MIRLSLPPTRIWKALAGLLLVGVAAACTAEGVKQMGSWQVSYIYDDAGTGTVQLWVDGPEHKVAAWVALDSNGDPLDGGDITNGQVITLPAGTEIVGVGVGASSEGALDMEWHMVDLSHE
jgi:hypothetical protein